MIQLLTANTTAINGTKNYLDTFSKDIDDLYAGCNFTRK